MDPTPTNDLDRIIASAHRLGVEMDEEEALQWLTAIAASQAGDEDVVVDIHRGVFGHRVSMLDFDPKDLEHFREIGRLVEFQDVPDMVETALALSGSAAQSKIQSFPTYQLIEVKFGSYPYDVVVDGHPIKAGSPVSWTPEKIRDGQIGAFLPDGKPTAVRWEDVQTQPGWCKLDWVVADPVRQQLANASNMLDVTWEAPDGTITPLDGYLDPYFQEVYLEAESIPIFSKLARHVSTDALDQYVAQLEKEVNKYLTKDVNYGKAAKRMYNVFRLTGRYEEAAFLRELFDEPTTLLYQIWSLIRTIDDCFKPNSSIGIEDLLTQTDQLILAIIKTLEGDQEAEIVRLLLRLRDSLSRQDDTQILNAQSEAARAEVINVVNNFFHERLMAVPTIKSYIESMSTK